MIKVDKMLLVTTHLPAFHCMAQEYAKLTTHAFHAAIKENNEILELLGNLRHYFILDFYSFTMSLTASFWLQGSTAHSQRRPFIQKTFTLSSPCEPLSWPPSQPR